MVHEGGGSVFSWASKWGLLSSSLSRFPSTLLFSSCRTSDHHSFPRCALKLGRQGKGRRKENITLALKEWILRSEESVLRYPLLMQLILMGIYVCLIHFIRCYWQFPTKDENVREQNSII